MCNKIRKRPLAPLVASLVLLSAATLTSATADAADAGGVTQLDPALKNIKFIENKVIPDIKSQANERPRTEGVDAEKWQQVQRFMEDGMPVLELYGYKPRRGKKLIKIVLFKNL